MKFTPLIIMLCFINCYTGRAQTADFTYSPATGNFCTPQTFTFTQTCSGNPTSFIWDFGNGVSGNEPSETITYTQAGTYTINLIAIYNNSAVTASKTIVVNITPSITLTSSRFNLCQPGPVSFTATASNTVSSYEWDFGDGVVQTTSTNTVTHNFNSFNSFRVVVKGVTAAGCSMTAANTIEVAKFPLSATVSPSNGCIPIMANFQVTATMLPGDSRQSILWNFGDGTPLVSNNFASYTHLYNTTNDITTAKIVVTTAQGCTNEYVFPKFGYGTPPTGINAYTTTGRDTFCGSEIVDFYATANGANLYTWDLDGVIRTSTINTISHKFRTLGHKNIIVTPSFNGCNGAKDTVSIFIEGVIAYFDITNSCSQKNNFVFPNNSLGNISKYEWRFSDQPALIDSTNFNAAHSFPSVGSFTTNLLLIDYTTGCRDSLEQNIYTAIPSFSSNINKVCKDSLITYTVGSSYPSGVGYSYEYHVNGGIINSGDSTSLQLNPTVHGKFKDFVVILDSIPGTCSDTLYLSDSTTVRGPVADFTLPSQLCADTAVNITNNSHPFYSNEPITTWRWDFGDNKFDSASNPPPHKYSRSGGTYNISLTATDINGCGQILVKPVIINPMPRINILPKFDTICSGQTVQLIGYSIDPLTWTPNTNINCTNCDTVLVSPQTNTNYIAKATSIFSCKSYDTAFIKVHEKFRLQVSPSDTSICPGMPIQFNLNKKGVTTWTPSTFLNNSTITNPVSRPEQSINYKIIVTDTAGCFTDSTIAKVFVYPKATVDAGPDIWLDYDMPFTLNPSYSPAIFKYMWTPAGTLSCTNCPNPTGRADVTTNYKIQITSNDGCKAEDSITIFLNCLNSKLYFPTAFTPNRDGRNDYFYPIAMGYEEIKSFAVFNRNGFKVFERKYFKPNMPTLGWDGTVKGDSQSNTQTFVWFAEVVCQGQTILKKGTVMLIR